MGSQPCCCKNTQDTIQEMRLKMEPRKSNLEIFVADLNKPIPLEQILPLQEEDDFALFLLMDQYDRLIVKNRTKAKSYSPACDIQTNSRENFTSYQLKRKNCHKPSKKTRSLTIDYIKFYKIYKIKKFNKLQIIFLIQNKKDLIYLLILINNTKLQLNKQFSKGIRSILKKKELGNNESSYIQQISDIQKSIKSVHFDVALSPKNSIYRQVDVLKKRKMFLKSYI